MAESSSIEWTDATWNPVTGCSVVSPGCTNCYAMKLAGTRLQHHPSRAGLTRDSKAGPVWTGEVRLNEKWLDQPLRWRRPRRIFVCAHGDLFHESVPDEWIDRIFAVMALAPQHSFQVLTKRADRMRAYVTEQAAGGRFITDWIARILAPLPGGGYDTGQLKGAARERLREANRRCGGTPFSARPLPNVWLGVSVEDQARADERIPDLLATPAAVRFLSCEPLLGLVDLDTIYVRRHGQLPTELSHRLGDYVRPLRGNFTDSPKLDWVIAGGESGPGARPADPAWVRLLRDQCADAGVAFFFKQWGAWHADALRYTDMEGRCPPPRMLIGKKKAGRLLDGAEHNAMPKVAA